VAGKIYAIPDWASDIKVSFLLLPFLLSQLHFIRSNHLY
jgi:hypothetical protein